MSQVGRLRGKETVHYNVKNMVECLIPWRIQGQSWQLRQECELQFESLPLWTDLHCPPGYKMNWMNWWISERTPTVPLDRRDFFPFLVTHDHDPWYDHGRQRGRHHQLNILFWMGVARLVVSVYEKDDYNDDYGDSRTIPFLGINTWYKRTNKSGQGSIPPPS